MTGLKVARNAVFGLLAFCSGWLLYPLGGYLWGFLLQAIVGPESRWGAEGSRLIATFLQPFACFLVAAAVSAFLAYSSGRLAVAYSCLVSLGTLSYFGFLLWATHAPVTAAARSWAFEGLFYVALLPAGTMLLVRLGWLSRRSRADRPGAGP